MIHRYVSATMTPVLLDQAHALRIRADRTRRLAKSIDDSETSTAILRYADELERRAAALEARTHERSFDSERTPACEATPG
jgi:hypothetical protein